MNIESVELWMILFIYLAVSKESRFFSFLIRTCYNDIRYFLQIYAQHERTDHMSIAVIYGGARQNGNTEQLTEYVIEGLQSEKFYLRDYHILPIDDQRHSERGFQDLGDDYNSVIKRVMAHDVLIFATPIYWYTMSGLMKNFVDRWTETLRDSEFPQFRQEMGSKKAFLIAVGGDEPHMKGLPLVLSFQHIMGYFGGKLDGYILGKGSKPGEILHDNAALTAAEQLRKKLS